jgi:hypothetical protein
VGVLGANFCSLLFLLIDEPLRFPLPWIGDMGTDLVEPKQSSGYIILSEVGRSRRYASISISQPE